MDLVPLDGLAQGLAHGPLQGLLAREPDAYGQQSEPVHGARARLDVVLDVLAEHLEAAADAEHRTPSAARRASASASPRSRSH